MKRFNIRVYGILLQEGKILVSDEYIKGNQITKFPGGGLEFGEGIKDCLLREFMEELSLEIGIKSHFYTTDFFVSSAYETGSQIISIYYLVETNQKITCKISETPHDYLKSEWAQSFRWIDIQKVSDDDFTLIIDKKVGEMLSSEFNK